MNAEDRQIAESLDAVTNAVGEWTIDLLWTRDPTMDQRYGADGRRLWTSEVRVLIQHLAEALAAGCPALFLHHARWSRTGFVAREVREKDLHAAVECLREVVAQDLPASVAKPALTLIDEALTLLGQTHALPESAICSSRPNASLARVYLLQLLQRDQLAAANVIFEAQREGKSLAELYESVLAPALAEIGRMWHLQEASVADEHYCTAATHMVMSQLRARLKPKMSNGRRVLAAAVGGDLHDVGIRMVADLFEMDGWHAEYLGANMPSEELVASLLDAHGQPAFDLLAVSAGTSLSVRAVADLIANVRNHPTAGSTPILVGGGPFRFVSDLWQVVGADAFASDAASALLVGARLVAGRTGASRAE
ncbi:MAG: cobalamin-dependent protein [Phycisphaerae bacterium]|nr:cobalamin-dependent protein [Phycisphaerae bacterium]